MSSFFLRNVQAIAALALAMSTMVCAQESVNGDAGSKVLALERLWGQAAHLRDIKALEAIFDEGIVLVNDDGSVQTKADFLASVKASGAQISAQQQQVAPESLNVHVFGPVAIATGVMRVIGVDGGKAYTRRERFVDTWLYKGGNWVCVGTDATPVLH